MIDVKVSFKNLLGSVLLDLIYQDTLYFGKEAPEELPASGSTGSWWDRVAGRGRGKHAMTARSVLLQNNTCNGQPASALGYFCNFLGLQRSFSESVKSLESQLLLVFLLFQASSARLVSPCNALNLHTFQ